MFRFTPYYDADAAIDAEPPAAATLITLSHIFEMPPATIIYRYAAATARATARVDVASALRRRAAMRYDAMFTRRRVMLRRYTRLRRQY